MGREMDIKNIPRVENLIQNDSWKVDARIKNDIEIKPKMFLGKLVARLKNERASKIKSDSFYFVL